MVALIVVPRKLARPKAIGSAFPSEGHDRDAQLAFECTRFRIIAGVQWVMLEEWARVELHSARRQPVAQQRRPRAADFRRRTSKPGNRILAPGDRRRMRISRRREIRGHFDAGVVATFIGSGNARIVVADAVAGMPEKTVRFEPGRNRLQPELGNRLTVRSDVAQICDVSGLTLDDLDVHGSLGCALSGGFMIARRAIARLIEIAKRLIGIAILLRLDRPPMIERRRDASLGFSPPPGGSRATEARLERPRERFGRAEADGERHVQYRYSGLRDEPQRGHFESAAPQIVAE